MNSARGASQKKKKKEEEMQNMNAGRGIQTFTKSSIEKQMET